MPSFIAIICLFGLTAIFLWRKGRRNGCPVEAILMAWFVLLSAELETLELPVVGRKLVFADAIALALFSFVLIKSFRVNSGRIKLERSARLSLLLMWVFISWMSLSACWNLITNTTLYTDMFVNSANILYGGLLASVVVVVARDRQSFYLSVYGWLAGAIIASLGAALAATGVAGQWAFSLQGGVRVSSTFQHINQLTGYVGFIFPFAVWELGAGDKRFHKKVFWAAIVGLLALSVLMTGSRTGTVLIILSLVFVGGLVWLDTRTRVGTKVGALVGFVSCVAIIAPSLSVVWKHGEAAVQDSYLQPIARPITGMKTAVQEGNEYNLGPRARQFSWVLEHYADSPILGYGPSTKLEIEHTGNEIHNTYLGILIEAGVFGLVWFILWIATVCWRPVRDHIKYKGKQPELLVLWFGFMCVLAYGVLNYGLGQRTFWLSAGLMIVSRVLSRRPGDTETQP